MKLPPKRALSMSLLTLAFLSCSTGCGRQYEANPMPRTSFAYVQDACGPTDGPAVEFYFTLKQSRLGKYEEPFILISINENLPSSVPQGYSIKSGKYAVLASRCTGRGNAKPRLQEHFISRRSALGRELLASMNSISRTEESKGTILMPPGAP